jgi:hypothetical protein
MKGDDFFPHRFGIQLQRNLLPFLVQNVAEKVRPAGRNAAFSRRVLRPSSAAGYALRKQRARGMPDAGRTHGPPATKKQAAVTTGSAETTGIPRAMALTAASRSPRCAGLFGHRHQRNARASPPI